MQNLVVIPACCLLGSQLLREDRARDPGSWLPAVDHHPFLKSQDWKRFLPWLPLEEPPPQPLVTSFSSQATPTVFSGDGSTSVSSILPLNPEVTLFPLNPPRSPSSISLIVSWDPLSSLSHLAVLSLCRTEGQEN